MAEDDFLLTASELLQRKRKRRRLVIIGSSILVVVGFGFLAAPHVRNAIRGMQARRHANHAFALIEQEKWREARDEATAAYQLRPNEPQALRAVARLLSRAGQTEGLNFWRNLAAVAPLNRQDLRDEARIALQANDVADAEEATDRLLENVDGKPTAPDFVLAAEVAVRKRRFDKVTELTEKVFADPSATRRDQMQANIALAEALQNSNRGSSDDARKVNARLVEIAKGDDEIGLEALAALGRRLLNAPAEVKNSFPMPGDELVKKLQNHPLAKPAHQLLAADLEIALHPDQHEEIEQRTIDRWKNGNNEELAALGSWLYRRGDYQLELDAIPLDRATQTRELFLEHVDALGALNRWDEIRRILENERFPLDPVIQHMYLARCFAQQGEQQGADNNWQRAIEDAAGDLSKLLILGDYAEKNGAREVAKTAYDAAVAVSPKSRPAQLGRLHTIYTSGDTKQIHEVLLELLKIWPNDSGLLNDEAYSRLLLLPADTKPDSTELRSIENVAARLVKEEPSSLPHRTLLALVMLKQNRPYSALALYRGLNVPESAIGPATLAVHAAVLAASGQPESARNEAEKIQVDKLLPEERALIKEL